MKKNTILKDIVLDALNKPGAKIVAIVGSEESLKERFSEDEMRKVILEVVTDNKTNENTMIWKYDKNERCFIFANGKSEDNVFNGGSRFYLTTVWNLTIGKDHFQGLEITSVYSELPIPTSHQLLVGALSTKLRSNKYNTKMIYFQ